jgi:integrase
MTRSGKPMRFAGLRYDAKTKTAYLDGYVAGTNGKMRRRKTIENVTLAQAQEAWKTFRADLASGRAVRGPITLATFIKEYWSVVSAHLAESTRITHRNLIDRHLLRYFGATVLERITSVRVADFQTDMRNRGLAASYINDAVRLLKMLLRQAVERDVIAEYPITKKTKIEKEHPLRLELSTEERRRFFATFDDEGAFREHVGRTRKAKGRNPKSDATTAHFLRYRALREFFIVAVETGLRNRTDLRNLRWREVDFEGGWIRVVMQKTEREATIPMSQACDAALRICRSKPVVSEFVFVDAQGRRWSLTRIRRTFALAKQLTGITRRFRAHDLRHTFGCRLASGGVPLQIIAKALGHTTTKMAEHYARPSDEAARAITGALDREALPPLMEAPAPRAGRPKQRRDNAAHPSDAHAP